MVIVAVEVEQAVERAGNRVGGAVADPPQVPVVFNEAESPRTGP